MIRPRDGALALALFASAGQAAAQTPTQPAQPTPPTAASDGSGEAQGQGQMRTAVLSDEQARSHFRIGEILYSEGRFADAAREFQQAYFFSGRAALLYNAYIAFRDANDIEHAIIVLDEYLRREPDIDDAVILRGRLAAMRATLESRMTEQSTIDAERARLEEERRQFEAQATRERARAEAAERQIERQNSPVPWIVGGAGVALLAGSGISALIANGNISDAEKACPDHLCPRDGTVNASDIRASVRRPALATDILLGVGGATLVTGVVLLITQRAGGDEAPEVAASCTDRGCVGNVTFRF